MTNRTIDLPAIFAEGANTVIPVFPTPGSGYRKEPLISADIENGWEFSTKVDSSVHNEVMFIVTSLLQQIAQQGGLSWCATTAYVQGATTIGSDGKKYKAVIANLNVDPTTAPLSTWKPVTGSRPGERADFFMNSAPLGFLACDGSAVSRTLYPDLFAAIGITWGNGDGGTTFNLPDARGEFVRGFDSGRGVDAGRVFATTQADSLKAHSHTIAFEGHTSTGTDGGGNVGSGSNSPEGIFAFDTQSTGGIETRPTNITALICIAI